MNTKETEALAFLIRKGPSRDKLLDNFKYIHDKGVALPISFCVEADEEDSGVCRRRIETVELHSITINGVSHADDTGQHFNLIGYCNWQFNDVGSFEFCEFRAHYDTQERNGTITLFIPKD